MKMVFQLNQKSDIQIGIKLFSRFRDTYRERWSHTVNEEESDECCMFVLNLLCPYGISISYNPTYSEPPTREGVLAGVQTKNSPKLKECVGLQ